MDFVLTTPRGYLQMLSELVKHSQKMNAAWGHVAYKIAAVGRVPPRGVCPFAKDSRPHGSKGKACQNHLHL